MKNFCKYTWILLVLLFVYAPIIFLAIYSFTDSAIIGNLGSFSLEKYVTLFTTSELMQMIWGTLILAIGVALLSTVLGTVGAIGSFYSSRNTSRFIELLNQIPVVNADVVTGFSVCILMIAIFHISKDTYIPLVVGQTTLCVPFVYLSVIPRLKQMENELYEAALDLGCTPQKALIKVVIPQIIPGILSGFVTAMTLSLDDYFVATYTKPAVFDTISTYVVNATRGARTEIKTALWALSTVIFVIVVLMVVMNNRFTRDKGKRG